MSCPMCSLQMVMAGMIPLDLCRHREPVPGLSSVLISECINRAGTEVFSYDSSDPDKTIFIEWDGSINNNDVIEGSGRKSGYCV